MLDRPGASGRFNRGSGAGAELTGGTCAVMSQDLDATARAPPMSAKSSLHQIENIADFVDMQQKCRAEKYRSANENCAKKGEEFFEEAQMLPCIQPTVICQPANQREQQTGQANLGKTRKHATAFQSPRLPPHQRVKQKKIDCRYNAGGKRQAAMSPTKPESEKPVQEKICANREEANDHRSVAFADRVKGRRQHFQGGVSHQADGIKLECPSGLLCHPGREPAMLINYTDDR